jgi:hypothetical protein
MSPLDDEFESHTATAHILQHLPFSIDDSSREMMTANLAVLMEALSLYCIMHGLSLVRVGEQLATYGAGIQGLSPTPTDVDTDNDVC